MPLKGGKRCVCGYGREHSFNLFCNFGQKVGMGKLVSMEDHAWVVIVFPLEMTVVSVNTAGNDCLLWTCLRT